MYVFLLLRPIDSLGHCTPILISIIKHFLSNSKSIPQLFVCETSGLPTMSAFSTKLVQSKKYHLSIISKLMFRRRDVITRK